MFVKEGFRKFGGVVTKVQLLRPDVPKHEKYARDRSFDRVGRMIQK